MEDIPASVQTKNYNDEVASGTAGRVPTRFEVGRNARGQTVVSDITSLAEEQVKLCLLTRCITKEVFLYYKFILLDSELDYGNCLQLRICKKLSMSHDQEGYWEMNREKVQKKLTRKRNNVTEAVRKKMTGKWVIAY